MAYRRQGLKVATQAGSYLRRLMSESETLNASRSALELPRSVESGVAPRLYL